MVIRESEEQLVISYSLLGNVSERELGKKNLMNLKSLCKKIERSQVGFIELEIV